MNDNKEANKQFNKIGIAYIIGTLLAYGIQYGVIALVKIGLLGNYLAEKFDNDGNIQLLVLYIPLIFIVYPLFLLCISKSGKKNAIEEHKMSVGQIILAFIMTYSATYVCNIIGAIITAIVGLIKGGAVTNPLIDMVMGTNIIVEILVMVIAAPICEELIFRKFLVDRIIKYGEGVAIVVSGLLFALFHGNVSQAVYAFTIGAFFAFIYIRTGRIRYTMIIHGMLNFMGSVAAGSILKALDLGKMMGYLSSGDIDAYMQFVMDNASAFAIAGIYFMFIFILVILGIIFWIVFRKKFFLKPTQNAIPKGERFKTVIINPGMIIYLLFWIVMIIVQLFS